MKHLFVKPIVMVLLLIVVPTALLTVFQLSSLNEQEDAFERIYERQLKSVILSVNMYADDVVGQWVSKVVYLWQNKTDDNAEVVEFIQGNSQILGIVLYAFSDETGLSDQKVLGNVTSAITAQVLDSCSANQTNISRLFTYFQSNYQKVISFSLAEAPEFSVFVFAMVNNRGDKWVGTLVVNTENFLIDILAPRIQSTAQQDMAMAVKNSRDGSVLYANNNSTEFNDDDIHEKLWQLPNYSIYLKPLGNTTEALIKKRSRNNLALLMAVDVLLLLGAILIYRNVRKQLHLAKIKADFVSNVSHEIRTPLALISMYAESLQLNRVKGEDKLQRCYHIIYREAKRLSSIVNNILNFSKMESGKRKFTFNAFDLNENIRNVVTRYQYEMQSNEVEFVLHIDKEIPPAWGDKDAIDEALVNLIDNAIKYSKDKKYVEIGTGIEGDEIWVEVKDRGIGIQRKQQALIFDQFYRVTEGNLAQDTKGSGLGLNIVKNISNAHRGSISVQSEPGKGSTFRMYLPRAKER